MIVICALLAIWTTIIVIVFRRIDKKAAIEVINATERSETGSVGLVEESIGGDKPALKV